MNFDIDRTISDGNLFVLGKNYYYPGTSVLSSQTSSTGTENLTITLFTPATAVGLDVGAFGNTAVTFTLSTGETFMATAPALTDLSFFGVTSSVSIVSLSLATPANTAGDVLNIDNFTFGTAAVPEPAFVAMSSLLALGGGGLLLRRRVSRV